MEIIDSLTEDEKTLVLKSGVPTFSNWSSDEPFDIDTVQLAMSHLSDFPGPLASYVLNRLTVWLEQDGVRWAGDDLLEASWSGEGATRTCRLTRTDGSGSWVVDWHPKWFTPELNEITLTRVDASGAEIEIANGVIADGKGRAKPKSWKGAVEGLMRLASLDDLCAFSSAIVNSIPAELLETTEEFESFMPSVNIMHAVHLEDMQPLMAATGGLPGRLCQAWAAFTAIETGKIFAGWMRNEFLPLIEGLREVGAEWGKGVVSYNDGDYSCCVVDYSDGAFGLFSDNAATGDNPHAYLARFDVQDGIVRSVGVYKLDSREDYNERVVAIGGGAGPDFVYDYESQMPSFPGGGAGWDAMALMYWQFVCDVTDALDEPNVKAGRSFWGSRSDDAGLGV